MALAWLWLVIAMLQWLCRTAAAVELALAWLWLVEAVVLWLSQAEAMV